MQGGVSRSRSFLMTSSKSEASLDYRYPTWEKNGQVDRSKIKTYNNFLAFFFEILKIVPLLNTCDHFQMKTNGANYQIFMATKNQKDLHYIRTVPFIGGENMSVCCGQG